MNKIEAIRKIGPFIDNTLSWIGRIAVPLRDIFVFSAADDRIALRKALCVAVERSGVSVAYGTRFLSSLTVRGVKHYPSADHAYPLPKEVASAVTLAAKELGVTGAGVTLSIPKAWAIIRSAEFPAAVRENISNAVTYEFDRLLPFKPEEAFYDFTIAGESAGKIKIVISAAKVEQINEYIGALGEQGYIVDSVTLNIAGMGELCRTISKGSKQGDFLFIGTEGDDYEGALFLGGTLHEVVSWRFSAEDDKSRAERIAADIKPLMAAAKDGSNDRHIYALLRDGRPALRERVRTGLGIPVVMLDEQKEAAYPATGGMMESLSPGSGKLDLLTRGRRAKAEIPLALTAILVAILLALGIGYFLAPIQVEEQRLAAIDRQIKLGKAEAKNSEALKKEIEAVNGEIARINGFKESRPLVLTILKELTVVLPKSAWLTRFRIIESRAEIEGYSKSASELLSRLEASQYFGKAEFSTPTFRDVRMNSDRFSIKMEIKGIKQTQPTAAGSRGQQAGPPGRALSRTQGKTNAKQ